MPVVLSPRATPRGVGIAHDLREVFVISSCCDARIQLNVEDTDRLVEDVYHYTCGACGDEVRGPDKKNTWLTEIHLFNSTEEYLAVHGSECLSWVEAWTGVEKSNMNITIELR